MYALKAASVVGVKMSPEPGKTFSPTPVVIGAGDADGLFEKGFVNTLVFLKGFPSTIPVKRESP